MSHDEDGFRVYTAKELKDTLLMHGFRECDIAACNCGSWHGGHASDRLRELRDVIGENGKTLLQSAEDLVAKVEEQKGEIERLEARYNADTDKIENLQTSLDTERHAFSMLNGRFVVQSRELAIQTERVRVMREAFKKYGFHKPECHRYVWDGWDTLEDGTKYSLLSENTNHDCNCGFEQALQDSLGDGK